MTYDMVSTMRWGDTLEDDDFDELTAQALVAAAPAKELKLPPKQVRSHPIPSHKHHTGTAIEKEEVWSVT